MTTRSDSDSQATVHAGDHTRGVYKDEANIFTAAQRINGGLEAGDRLLPPQITADQNNYNPTGLSTALLVEISSDSTRNITGLAATGAQRVLFLRNTGSFAITLKHESASSTATNRFYLPGLADVVLNTENSVVLVYMTGDRWKVLARS